jgi:purine-binding chemotaxis protein CheW
MSRDLVTVSVAGQLFGIPVAQVRDVLPPPRLTPVPLAPPEIAGMLNLRGRIVIAIDMRRRLGYEPAPPDARAMCVVVEHDDEFYSLIVDSVGEVIQPDEAGFDSNPSTLDPVWRGLSNGLYRLDGALLLVIDIARTLDLRAAAA